MELYSPRWTYYSLLACCHCEKRTLHLHRVLSVSEANVYCMPIHSTYTFSNPAQASASFLVHLNGV